MNECGDDASSDDGSYYPSDEEYYSYDEEYYSDDEQSFITQVC